MFRILGFKSQVLYQVMFQLLSILVLLAIVFLVVYVLVMLIKVLKKKSRLLDLEIKEKERKELDD